MLAEEFLKPLHITQRELGNRIGFTPAQVSMLVNRTLGVTPRTAWLLAQAFGTSPQLWMNLQMLYDLAHEKPSKKVVPFEKHAP
jgi:addiction module HigA family antidote